MDLEEKTVTTEKNAGNKNHGKILREKEKSEGTESGNGNISMVPLKDKQMKGAKNAKEKGVGKKNGMPEKVKELEEKKGKKVDSENVNKTDATKETCYTRKRRVLKKVTAKEETYEGKYAHKKGIKLSSIPISSLRERPVRERKSVKRLVEVIEKIPNPLLKIEKGRGTPLKDIPNVAYKLSKKRPYDLTLLHQTLFGRKGKVINFKNNILKFSGFVWHENEEKQRARIKERLDKYLKDILLDFCLLFDIPVTKTTTKKEELVMKLLDFLIEPRVLTDVILADKVLKSKKRKNFAKGLSKNPISQRSEKLKKRAKTEDLPTAQGDSFQNTEEEDEEDEGRGETDSSGEDEEEEDEEDEGKGETDSSGEDEEEDEEDEGRGETDSSGEDEEHGHSLRNGSETEDDDESPDKGGIKKSVKHGGASVEKLKVQSGSKKAPPSSTRSRNLPSSSGTQLKSVERNDSGGEKVVSKKKKGETTKLKAAQKMDSKGKATGKLAAKIKSTPEKLEKSGPSEMVLREEIRKILNEVDMKTGTFSEITAQLSAHFEIDLSKRKEAIKLLIEDELTTIAMAAENESSEYESDA